MTIIGKLHHIYSNTEDASVRQRIEAIYAYRKNKRKRKQAERIANFEQNEVIPVRNQILNTSNYVVVDGEFEGIETAKSRPPLEFSICIVRDDGVVALKRYIVGSKKKPKTIYRKTEIFQNVTLEFLLAELKVHLKGLPIVGYNIGMELEFLEGTYAKERDFIRATSRMNKRNRGAYVRKHIRPYSAVIDLARAVQVIDDKCQIQHPSLWNALNDRKLPNRGLHNSANDVYYQYLIMNDLKSDQIYQWHLPTDM